jgi:hypothetical protein
MPYRQRSKAVRVDARLMHKNIVRSIFGYDKPKTFLDCCGSYGEGEKELVRIIILDPATNRTTTTRHRRSRTIKPLDGPILRGREHGSASSHRTRLEETTG